MKLHESPRGMQLANKSPACMRDVENVVLKEFQSPIKLLKCKTNKTCKIDDTKWIM